MKIIRKRLLSLRFKSGMLVIILLFLSCDTTIDPLDRETGVYAIYGTLDLNKTSNYIRVRDLNVPFTSEATETIDAFVQLEQMNTGESFTLPVVRKDVQGVYEFNFVHELLPQPDTEYLLSVERSDGEMVMATAKTPTKPDPVITPINQNCYTPIEFKLGPLNSSILTFQIGITSRNPNREYIWSPEFIFRPEDYQTSNEIKLSFTPHEILKTILWNYDDSNQCGDPIADGEIYINYTHYGPGFYEEVFETEYDIARTQRFGSLYYDTLAIPIDTTPVCPQDCE